MDKIYRVSYQTVIQNTHPQAYGERGPLLRADEIPERWWQTITRECADQMSVINQIVSLTFVMSEGDLIRNIAYYEGEVKWFKREIYTYGAISGLGKEQR